MKNTILNPTEKYMSIDTSTMTNKEWWRFTLAAYNKGPTPILTAMVLTYMFTDKSPLSWDSVCEMMTKLYNANLNHSLPEYKYIDGSIYIDIEILGIGYTIPYFIKDYSQLRELIDYVAYITGGELFNGTLTLRVER